jgi:hypothetical protein
METIVLIFKRLRLIGAFSEQVGTPLAQCVLNGVKLFEHDINQISLETPITKGDRP